MRIAEALRLIRTRDEEASAETQTDCAEEVPPRKIVRPDGQWYALATGFIQERAP